MGVSISGLVAATNLNNDDVFEIEQSGVSKKISKATLLSLLSVINELGILPRAGDVIFFGGVAFNLGDIPRWRVIYPVAYTTASPATSSTITFSGGVTANGIQMKANEYFSVGDPVRIQTGVSTFSYGICSAVTDSLLTIAGAILPLTTIFSLASGSPDMVQNVQMCFAAATYNGSTTLVLTRGCQHRWRGKTGYLVSYSCSHMNTSATIRVQLQMSGGSDVATSGVIPAAGTATTHGAFVDLANGQLIAANVAISDNQTITAKTPVITGLGDFLIINMTFVVP